MVACRGLAIGAATLINLATLGASSADLIAVATGHVLYQENAENRRLIIEPGTRLALLQTDPVEVGGFIVYRVRTATGIAGTMRRQSVEVMAERPFPDDPRKGIAVVKRAGTHDEVPFLLGRIHPYEKFVESDRIQYKVATGLYKYHPGAREFVPTEPSHVTLSASDMNRMFTILGASGQEDPRFSEWQPRTDGGEIVRQKWGCQDSYQVVDFLNAAAEAETGADVSFWRWFKAKFGASVKVGTERKRTVDKHDPEFLHQLTFWRLNAPDSGESLLEVVIDKRSPCSSAEDARLEYQFEFPGDQLDDFGITHSWSEAAGLRPLGNAPMSLSTLDDLQRLQHELDKAKFLQSGGQSFEHAPHLRDLIVMITAVVLPPSR